MDPRTIQRWKERGADQVDRRAGPKTPPANALSAAEREQIVTVANSPQFRNLSVHQIVPLLADEGTYLASESSFYRVLKEQGLASHRGPVRPAQRRRRPTLVAHAPNQVWCWDITYLQGPVRGTFFYLYLHVDLYSRKIVAWDVHDQECMDLAAQLAEQACRQEGILPSTLTLHSDNGGPMKGSTMVATLQRLGIAPSFSRPHVSDDNPFCESLFRTLKYRPGFPQKPFASLQQARAWVADFVAWYNHEHLHSSLRYLSPAHRHAGLDADILAHRQRTYAAARARNPRRWSRNTRNWTPIGPVELNPENGQAQRAA